MRSTQSFHMMAATTALLLGGAYFGTETGRFLLHFVLGQLSHGVSAGKIGFLLAFALAVFLRLAFASDKEPRRSRWVWLVVIALGLGYVGGLTAHLFVISTYRLPLDQPVWSWRDGINSRQQSDP